MITIRMATICDVPTLLPLMAQLGYPTSQTSLENRFNSFCAQKGYGVAVACNNQNVVGLIAWSQSHLFVSNTTRIHIEGLIVDEKYRGQGVGKKLMDFLEVQAKQTSPAIIDLTSGVRRNKDGSHDFYRSLGYHNDGPKAKYYFRKEV